jgi:hypothetical protein
MTLALTRLPWCQNLGLMPTPTASPSASVTLTTTPSASAPRSRGRSRLRRLRGDSVCVDDDAVDLSRSCPRRLRPSRRGDIDAVCRRRRLQLTASRPRRVRLHRLASTAPFVPDSAVSLSSTHCDAHSDTETSASACACTTTPWTSALCSRRRRLLSHRSD